ncbi:MAG: respiratory chain complex I subunit 1 family protein, partial [Cellulosilyticaceae bacterium]
LILAPIVGGLLAGMDRKISARMQGRIGPPILQPFYDVMKLFQKETLTTHTTQKLYVGCFLVFMMFTGVLFFAGGDLLLMFFSFTLASIFFVLAAYSSGSPYSAIGAERELLQMMAYEPVVLMTAVGFFKVTGTFDVTQMTRAQVPAILCLPGVFVGFVYILTIKLRKSPFDLSTSHHGHQEIVKGLTTECSGSTLALIEIAHWYENVLLLGIVVLFFLWESPWSIVLALFMGLLVYFLEIVVDNVCARVKWQLLFKSAWLIGGACVFVNLFVLALLE